MESFEANSQFLQLLRNINPSVQSLKKTAHFAIKNWESEDYLLPSILNLLEDRTVELNTKSTIFQFIDVLINESYTISLQPKSNYSYPYINNLKNELPLILLKVLPGTSNYNLYNVFNSLKSISRVLKIDTAEYEQRYKRLESEGLDQQDRENIDQNMPHPEITLEDEMTNDGNKDPLIATWNLLIQKRKQSYYERLRLLQHQPPIEKDIGEDELFHLKPKGMINPTELSKKQILLRMEDDREAHKRSKENLWVVERSKNINHVTEDEFFHYYWNKYDVLTGDDQSALLQSLDDFNSVVLASYKDDQI